MTSFPDSPPFVEDMQQSSQGLMFGEQYMSSPAPVTNTTAQASARPMYFDYTLREDIIATFTCLNTQNKKPGLAAKLKKDLCDQLCQLIKSREVSGTCGADCKSKYTIFKTNTIQTCECDKTHKAKESDGEVEQEENVKDKPCGAKCKHNKYSEPIMRVSAKGHLAAFTDSVGCYDFALLIIGLDMLNIRKLIGIVQLYQAVTDFLMKSNPERCCNYDVLRQFISIGQTTFGCNWSAKCRTLRLSNLRDGNSGRVKEVPPVMPIRCDWYINNPFVLDKMYPRYAIYGECPEIIFRGSTKHSTSNLEIYFLPSSGPFIKLDIVNSESDYVIARAPVRQGIGKEQFAVKLVQDGRISWLGKFIYFYDVALQSLISDTSPTSSCSEENPPTKRKRASKQPNVAVTYATPVIPSFGLIILGRPGVGKTLIANVLIGQDLYIHEPSSEPVTIKTEHFTLDIPPYPKVTVFNIPGVLDNGATAAEIQRAFEIQSNSIIIYVFTGGSGGRICYEDFQALDKTYQFNRDSLFFIVNQLPLMSSVARNRYEIETTKSLEQNLHIKNPRIAFLDCIDMNKADTLTMYHKLLRFIGECKPSIHRKQIEPTNEVARLQNELNVAEEQYADTIRSQTAQIAQLSHDINEMNTVSQFQPHVFHLANGAFVVQPSNTFVSGINQFCSPNFVVPAQPSVQPYTCIGGVTHLQTQWHPQSYSLPPTYNQVPHNNTDIDKLLDGVLAGYLNQ